MCADDKGNGTNNIESSPERSSPIYSSYCKYISDKTFSPSYLLLNRRSNGFWDVCQHSHVLVGWIYQSISSCNVYYHFSAVFFQGRTQLIAYQLRIWSFQYLGVCHVSMECICTVWLRHFKIWKRNRNNRLKMSKMPPCLSVIDTDRQTLDAVSLRTGFHSVHHVLEHVLSRLQLWGQIGRFELLFLNLNYCSCCEQVCANNTLYGSILCYNNIDLIN